MLKKHLTPQNHVLAVVLWEFFSYYGVRALLILYLTQKLVFTDQHAYALYGSFTALIYVSPIIGGWFADRYIGYKMGTYIGCGLIILGHLCLKISAPMSLYLGLALLVCGIGFFKSNAICLIGDCYSDDPQEKASGFALYYVAGNIGGTFGPILTALAMKYYGYSTAFSIAAFGMALGVFILWTGRDKLRDIGNVIDPKAMQPRFQVLTLVSLVAAVITFMYLLKFTAALYVLIAISMIATYMTFQIVRHADPKALKRLFLILVLSLFATLFWVFDQQGGSSINLFISRNINKLGVPTAMFQSINPFVIVFAGLLLAKIWHVLAQRKMMPSVIIKLAIGMVLLTLGFFSIALSAHAAMATGVASLWGPVIGMCILGVSELFIDPVIISEISEHAPVGHYSFFTGMYYFLTGAVANYLAAKVATFTDVTVPTTAVNYQIQSAAVYAQTYKILTLVSLAAVILLLLMKFLPAFRRAEA